MKIALLTDNIYPYAIGGMQKHSYQLVKYFIQKKHTVYLFHSNASAYNIDNLEFFSNEEKKYIKSFVIPYPRLPYFPFHYFYESKKYAQLLAQALNKIIAEIDFVFVQGFCASALPPPAAKKDFPPVVLHLHGMEMFQPSPSFKAGVLKYMLRALAKANLKKADYAISFGGKITTFLEKFIKKEQIWEIPGGIDESWFRPNSKKSGGNINFVFVGRYERRKGIQELHSAIKMLLPHGKFHFDFIGPIPNKNKIKSPAICYHGELSSEQEIKKILSHCDVLVCPSFAEGMPYVIMEGMACGLAVAATNVGAVPMLVNPDIGWLIDKPAPTEIFKTLLLIVNEKAESIEQKKSNSSQKIKNYTFEKVTGRLMEHMEELNKKVSSLP